MDEADIEARRLEYRRRADEGDVRAMVSLAEMAEGSDPEKAMVWYRKAAELGYSLAAYNLGQMLSDNRPEEAEEWLLRAADLGDPDAMGALATCSTRATPPGHVSTTSEPLRWATLWRLTT